MSETFAEKFKGKIQSVGRGGPGALLSNASPKFLQKENRPANIALVEKKTTVSAAPAPRVVPVFAAPAGEDLQDGDLNNRPRRELAMPPDPFMSDSGLPSGILGPRAPPAGPKSDWRRENFKLGGLGANFSEEWQLRRRTKERQATYADMIRDINAEKISRRRGETSSVQPKKAAPVGPSSRAKALEFARQVPKPALRSVAAKPEKQAEAKEALSHLEYLESQHSKLKKLANAIR